METERRPGFSHSGGPQIPWPRMSRVVEALGRTRDWAPRARARSARRVRVCMVVVAVVWGFCMVVEIGGSD